MNNFQLQYNNGDQFDLYKFLDDKWGIVFFFRGIWCTICKKQLKEFEEHFVEIKKLNCKIIAISNDSKFKSNLAENFFQLSFPVLSDQNLEVIDPLELKTTFKNKITAKPAIFVINQNKELVYKYIGDSFDDRLEIKSIIEKIKQLQQ
jgi:peroxiredoxin